MWQKWLGKSRNINTELANEINLDKLPKHIAIIMDGNGRWAQKKGMPRTVGHHAGAETLKTIVRTASDMGIKVLTVYAFSTENWKRPAKEVSFLMNLLSSYLDANIDELHQRNVQMRFIGKIAELAPALKNKMEQAQLRTANNTGLIFNIAVNYGGRSEITRAVQLIIEKVMNGQLQTSDISQDTIQHHLYTAGLPDPDLLIRPSGDYRISNFLLWQLAYTEFWLTDTLWPDFTPDIFMKAIIDYQHRERRFGGLKK